MQRLYPSRKVKLSFRGGFFALFHCSIPRARNHGNHHIREFLKGSFFVRIKVFLSLSSFSLKLLQMQVWVLRFRCLYQREKESERESIFYIISVQCLVNLPRAKDLCPRCPQPSSYTFGCGARGLRIGQTSSAILGWALTTRLDSKPIVLARRCSRHIYTYTHYFLAFERVPTVPALGI